jgi:serine/threonine-protein kinase HipA
MVLFYGHDIHLMKSELLMAPRIANIHFKDRFAGVLSETPGAGTRFVYAQQWQEDIACALPVAQREFVWEAGLHPFFQHLTPEGWLREKQARAGNIGQEDDLGLLIRYGLDCVGAVSVLPVEPKAIDTQAVEAEASPGRTISGVQKKLLVVPDGRDFFKPAAPDGPAPYIAKFNSETLPTLVRNEKLSLDWVSAVLGKAEVNETRLATVAALNQVALVVKRFDRTANGEKLRLEDCAQILSRPRGRDYQGKYDAAYEDIAAVIDTHSVRPAIDKAKLLARIIAYVIVGNCDGHLKNFSLLETEQGLRLSPVYDVVNTALYKEYDQRFALAINGRKRQLDEIDGSLLNSFGLSIGLPQRAVDQTFAEIARGVKKAAPLLEPPQGEPPDGFVHRYREIVQNACLRVLT